MPFMAASFNRVTFSALLLNYAAVPLFGAIMAAGYLFFPLSFFFPPGARLLAWGLKLSIQVFIRITHLLDGVPFASYRIPTPHLVTVCGYFLFLGLLLAPPKIKRQRLIVSTLFASFFIVLISYPFPSTSKNLKLTFIDVGQGDSILIQFPGHKKMLIDGGGLPGTTFDIGERVVSPVLWRKGIKRLDFLVLTHAHSDHVNGLAAVARNFTIGEFWETGEPVEDPAYAGLRASLPRSAVPKKISRGFTAGVGGVNICVLHPGPDLPLSSSVDNDRSLVLRLIYGRTSFLLAADIGLEAEEEVLLNFPEIRSQVLKAAHHGSNTSTSEPFLSRVAPEFVVISVGRGNRFGFPQPAVLERLKRWGAKVFRTDLDGAIEIGSDGLGLSFRCAARDKSS
jgi:competence protein ComEC